MYVYFLVYNDTKKGIGTYSLGSVDAEASSFNKVRSPAPARGKPEPSKQYLGIQNPTCFRGHTLKGHNLLFCRVWGYR